MINDRAMKEIKVCFCPFCGSSGDFEPYSKYAEEYYEKMRMHTYGVPLSNIICKECMRTFSVMFVFSLGEEEFRG